MEICYVDGGELGIGMYWYVWWTGGRSTCQANGMDDLTFSSSVSGMDLDVDKVWNEDQGQGQADRAAVAGELGGGGGGLVSMPPE